MANIIIVTDDKTHASINPLALNFSDLGHSVIIENISDLETNDLITFDLIISARISNQIIQTNKIANAFKKGTPILVGTIGGVGVSSTSSFDSSSLLGIISELKTLNNSIGQIIITNNENPFYPSSLSGEIINAYENSSFSWSFIPPYAQNLKIVANNANRDNQVAFLETGSTTLSGDVTTARFAANGFLYGLGGFTDEQKAAMGKMVDWLTSEIEERNVKGKVTLDKAPYGVKVVITTADFENPTLLGFTESDSLTGEYEFKTNYKNPVLIHTMQDYGSVWVAGTAKVIGDVVHSTTPNGYIYKVTRAGNTGQTEPVWTAEQNISINDGSVIYESERLLKPEIEGYVTPTPII